MGRKRTPEEEARRGAHTRAAEQGERYGHGGYPNAVQGNDSGVHGGQP